MKLSDALSPVQKRLADNLRRLRQEKNLQQERVAWESGLDRSFYGRIERGEANPSLNVLVRLAERLEVDVTALLEQKAATHKASRNERRDHLSASQQGEADEAAGVYQRGYGIKDTEPEESVNRPSSSSNETPARDPKQKR